VRSEERGARSEERGARSQQAVDGCLMKLAIKGVLRRYESPQPREVLEHAAVTCHPKYNDVCCSRMPD